MTTSDDAVRTAEEIVEAAGVADGLPPTAWRPDWDMGITLSGEKTGGKRLDAAVRIHQTRITDPTTPDGVPTIQHRIAIARGVKGEAGRREYVGGWISDDDLASSRRVLASAMGHDIDMPHHDQWARGELEQMLRREAPRPVRAVRETGWRDGEDERPAFVLPSGAIGADGVDEHIVATIDPKTDQLTQVIPGDVGVALRALDEAVQPLRDDILAVCMGSLAAQTACLTGARPRGAVSIEGRQGSGKTHALMSSVMTGRDYAPSSLIGGPHIEAGSTTRSIGDAGAGRSDVITVLDDVRDPDPDRRGGLRGITEGGGDALMRRAYGGGSAGRTRLGRDHQTGVTTAHAPDPTHPLVFITSEVAIDRVMAPGSAGFRSRYIRLAVGPGSAADRGAALDALCADGYLEAIAAAIIQQTAAAHENTAALRAAARAAVDAEAAELTDDLGPRQAGHVAVMRHGASVLESLASAHGVDLSGDLDRADAKWVEAAEAGVTEATTGHRSAGVELIDELKQALVGGRASLLHGGDWMGGTGAYDPADEIVPMIGERKDDVINLLTAGVAKVVQGGRTAKGVATALADMPGVELRRVRVDGSQVRAAVVPIEVWENDGETDV